MDKEQSKELWPIIKAFAEGKPIEVFINNQWVNLPEDTDLRPMTTEYRIKPEPKYRPFKDAKECWQEMQKHKPFGWVEYKDKKSYTTYCDVNDNCAFNLDFDDYIFVDGEPFGIKEE